MIDYHWDRDSMTYDPAYVYPTSWKITFNGCQTGEDYSNPTNPADYYVWKLGDTINSPSYDLQWSTEEGPHWDYRGSGILGIYRGENTNVPYGDYDHYIKPHHSSFLTNVSSG